MWDWLWGSAAKPRPKQLSALLDRLLGAGPQLNGDEAFELPEKEVKRLCSAARWARWGGQLAACIAAFMAAAGGGQVGGLLPAPACTGLRPAAAAAAAASWAPHSASLALRTPPISTGTCC